MCCACTQCYNCPKCTTALFHGISLDGCQLPVPVPSTLIIWLSHCCLMLGRCFISPATARTCIDSASHSKRITSRLAAACFPLLFFYPIAFFCCFFFFCVHNLIFKTASFSISVFKVKFKLKFKHTPMCVFCFFSCSLFFFSYLSLAETYVREKCCWTILCASPNSIVLPLVCFQESCEKMMLMPFYFLFILLDFFWLVQH